MAVRCSVVWCRVVCVCVCVCVCCSARGGRGIIRRGVRNHSGSNHWSSKGLLATQGAGCPALNVSCRPGPTQPSIGTFWALNWTQPGHQCLRPCTLPEHNTPCMAEAGCAPAAQSPCSPSRHYGGALSGCTKSPTCTNTRFLPKPAAWNTDDPRRFQQLHAVELIRLHVLLLRRSTGSIR